MSRKEKKSFDIIVYAMMILAVIYAIVQSVLGNNQELHFKLTLGIWILAAVVISDFVEPMVNREFDAMNEQELKKFLPYAITDAGAYICVYMFVVNAGMYKEPVHYVFLVLGLILFVVKGMLWNGFHDETKRRVRIESVLEEEQKEKEQAKQEKNNQEQ
jgi:hypothetical protein